ncbi:MAG: class I tRNA ligase family protein [Oscillospiraceae bacterium]|nr:class I tRNA ligase family protein [Oscillospiraceae bacterium]
MKNCVLDNDILNSRPKLPKRAVITSGMPYGSKELHFGHIGLPFIQSDAFARFLRDRIGAENVVYVSGTDCYGSPAIVEHRRKIEDGAFSGTLEEFCIMNHEKQRECLDKYMISLNLYAASAFGDAKEIHESVSAEFFSTLYKNGHLRKITTSQFYDTEKQAFLNGRQVVGRCPIQGCKGEKAYADECDMGHQYTPSELIAPKSVLSGNVPEMRDVTNWYFDLPKFRGLIGEWNDRLRENPDVRKFIVSTIDEFLKAPVIYVKNEDLEVYEGLKSSMPHHSFEEGKTSFTLAFDKLEERDKACKLLTGASVRYRTGKTLVPFRLTGNVEWGVPVPELAGEDTSGLTFWVWPESLWAPISFTQTYLKSLGKDDSEWKNWWCDPDSTVYQFIGADCISFYGPAEAGMWMGMQSENPVSGPPSGKLNLPYLVAGNHVLFLDKKASSSGSVKPPMAMELLDYYTPEQLRAHFLGLGLGIKSVSFRPKPLDPNPKPGEDPALKEGNLLTNVFNRVARSCFYTAQTYFGGLLPNGDVDRDILTEAQKTVIEYEKYICAHEFHSVMSLMDVYIRGINKYWAANMKQADAQNDGDLRKQVLVNAFHMLRTAAVLVHPIAPLGTEMIREYLGFEEDFWDWARIFETVYDFMPDRENHRLKTLEPRVDFFSKHPAQFVPSVPK